MPSNPDPCPACGLTYEDHRGGATYADAYEWAAWGTGRTHTGQRAVLRELRRNKLSTFDRHVAECERAAAFDEGRLADDFDADDFADGLDASFDFGFNAEPPTASAPTEAPLEDTMTNDTMTNDTCAVCGDADETGEGACEAHLELVRDHGYTDEDGIDGPFDRAMAAAMAEDRALGSRS